MTAAEEHAPRRRWNTRVLIALISAVAVVAAVWIGGELAGPVPDKPSTPDTRPPLVVVAGPGEKAMAKGAKLLSQGAERDAERVFSQQATEDTDAVAPQVGIALSKWDRLGPEAVIADLEQIEREYPADPYVMLHLGIANVARDEASGPAGQKWLRRTLDAAAKSKQWEIWGRADDLTHAQQALGYPPIVVKSDTWELPEKQRDALADELGKSMRIGDRPRMRAIASQSLRELGSEPAPNLRSALAVATLDKDDPDAALAIAKQVAGASASTRIQYALLLVWIGQRQAGLQELERAQAMPEGKELATLLLRSLS